MNLLPAKVERILDGRALLQTEIGHFLAVGTGEIAPSTPCLLGIRPQDVIVSRAVASSDANLVKAVIVASRFSSEGTYYRARVGAVFFDVRVRRGVDFAEGDSVMLRLPPEFCVAVRRQPDSVESAEESLTSPCPAGDTPVTSR